MILSHLVVGRNGSDGKKTAVAALRAGSHCVGEESRKSDPPQAENPAWQDSLFSVGNIFVAEAGESGYNVNESNEKF